jgi:hypothetical protein
MKKRLWTAVVLLACSALLTAHAASSPEPTPNPAAHQETPGVEAARTLSTLTGVAISPLLGVGAVGAWKYYKAPPQKRAGLPWFAQPWFWISALAIVGLVFLKETLGPTMPTAFKKPLDLLELFENKLSAAIAAGVLIPMITSMFESAGETSQFAHWGLAMIDPRMVLGLLVLPAALAAFLVVFLAGHAVNVLVLISPFATLDAILKSFRLFLMATVMATSLLHPYLGAAWALVLIGISYFIAGWSWRLTIFGGVFSWDLLTFRHRRFAPAPGPDWVFTARKIGKTPVRTYGTLARDEQGRLVLRYRPWLVLAQRELVLPAGRYFVGRGLFYPEVHRIEGADSRGQLALPPRYRTHEEDLAHRLALGPVENIGLRKGLKALWDWLQGLFGRNGKTLAAQHG